MEIPPTSSIFLAGHHDPDFPSRIRHVTDRDIRCLEWLRDNRGTVPAIGLALAGIREIERIEQGADADTERITR